MLESYRHGLWHSACSPDRAIAGGLKAAPATPGILGAVIPRVFGVVAIPVIAGISIPITILGIVAIMGGIYALKRRVWGLALAGSICSLVCVFFLGIPAIMFVAIGKGEFE